MNHLYKSIDEITEWLDSYAIENYSLIKDPIYGFKVDVQGNVNLANKGLSVIPVKFNEVYGSFICSHNSLDSMEFCPSYVEKNFFAEYNNFSSLEFCPKIIGYGFYCNHNKIKSLEYFPEKIDGIIELVENPQLSIWQNEKHFDKLRQEHLKIKSLNLAHNLETILDTKDKKVNKVKI